MTENNCNFSELYNELYNALSCCQLHILIKILASKQNPFSWKPKLYSVDGFKAEDSMEEVNKDNSFHGIHLSTTHYYINIFLWFCLFSRNWHDLCMFNIVELSIECSRCRGNEMIQISKRSTLVNMVDVSDFPFIQILFIIG